LLRLPLVTYYHILIKECCTFLVMGCSELTPPKHAWYKREGDEAVIGCQDNDKEWKVKCTGNVWIGEIGNCTKTGLCS